jgi:hypothetical protein
MQAGHWKPGRAGSGKNFLDERAIHGQCDHCNIHREGAPAVYAARMEARYSAEVLDELRHQANTPHKWSRAELVSIKKSFEQKTKELLGE